MDKIEKQEIKVEKTPQMDNDFKIHTKSLTQSSYFENYTYLAPQGFFQFNFGTKTHF